MAFPGSLLRVLQLLSLYAPSIYNYPEQSRQEYNGAKEANAYPDDGDKSHEPHCRVAGEEKRGERQTGGGGGKEYSLPRELYNLRQ